MSRLRFVDSQARTMQLDGAHLQLQRLLGAGMPDVVHQTVRTPSRDGEHYLGHSVLEPRYLIAELAVVGLCSWQEEVALRNRLIERLNPKLGEGVLIYRPSPAAEYEISALVEGGLGFDDNALADGFLRALAVNFRCVDPAWRGRSPLTVSFNLEDTGLDVPIDIPLGFGSSAASQVVNNLGHLEVYPIFTFTPTAFVESPAFTNETSGQRFALPGLRVEAGEELIVNLSARTATVAGASVMAYRSLDSVVWALAPGSNTVRVSHGAAGGSGYTATMTYEQRLLGV